MNKQTLSAAALSLVLLAASGAAAACELGPMQHNAAGERQIAVIDSYGQQVGMTLQGRDGRWEAIVESLGALNQQYSSARAAAQAICEKAEH